MKKQIRKKKIQRLNIYEVSGRGKGIPSSDVMTVEVKAKNAKVAEKKGKRILGDRWGGDVIGRVLRKK